MRKLFLFVAGIIVLLYACKDENTKPENQFQTFEINATSSTEWKYFSFAENDTIQVTDPSSSSDWDLAFQRYRIRTNGGRSGNGLGAAANTGLKGQAGFDALTFASDTLSYVVDDSLEVAVQQGYKKYVVNPEIYNWFTMEMAQMGTQIVPTDSIFVVKTGRGKYAKLWIKSYYSATDASGFVTIQYKYQQDGSANLE